MTRYQLIMAMYNILEQKLTEDSSEEYCDFVAGLDPYLWTDGKTADPDIYDEFSALADEKGLPEDIEPGSGMALILEFIKRQDISDMTYAFENIYIKEWNKVIEDMTKNTTAKKACDCCGYFTLEAKDQSVVCPVCYWEDDKAQRLDPTLAGGANKPSLEQAKENFAVWGACDEKVIPFTRMPTAEEVSGLTASLSDDSEEL